MSLFSASPSDGIIGLNTSVKREPPQTFTSVLELATDEEKAKQYVLKREDEAKRLMHDLKWQPGAVSWTLDAELYGNTVRHELKARTLHATPCWGEMYFKDESEPVMFLTFENFVAFVLARWW